MNKFQFACLLLICLTSCNTSSQKGNSKVKAFNQIDQTRDLLSEVGIGKLDVWKEDGNGGYMSITPYFQFGNGLIKNNVAYYLTSQNEDVIQQLDLVLNLNHGNRTKVLAGFSELVSSTYEKLGMPTNQKIIVAAKKGIAYSDSTEEYTSVLRIEKSKIETFHFSILSN